MAMLSSGMPSKWNGKSPCLSVLRDFFDPSKGETPDDGYGKYMQLPCWAFFAQLRSEGIPMGPLDEKGNYPVAFTEEQIKQKKIEHAQKEQQVFSQSGPPFTPEASTPAMSTPASTPAISTSSTSTASGAASTPVSFCTQTSVLSPPTKKARHSQDEARKNKERLAQLEKENEEALDEAYQKNLAQQEIDRAYEDEVSKAMAFIFRKKGSAHLLHNPHYLLPSFSPKRDKIKYLTSCINQREIFVMRVIHQTILVLRSFPNQAMCSSSFYPALQRVISKHGLCLDPTSGGAESFFQMPLPPQEHSHTLAMAKFLHIVRVPLCATFSMRQLLHPTVFPPGYPDPTFPHILYNQIAQNFYRSLSLRHLTLGIHSPDILFLFGDLPEFKLLVDYLEDLEWWVGEMEFDAHRSVFSPPPGGFGPALLSELFFPGSTIGRGASQEGAHVSAGGGSSGSSGGSARGAMSRPRTEQDRTPQDLFNQFLTHFVLQLNISDRLKMPMVPFPNKPGQVKYEAFSSALIQKMEAWRPLFKELAASLPLPSSIFSSKLKEDGTTENPSAVISAWEGKTTSGSLGASGASGPSGPSPGPTASESAQSSSPGPSLLRELLKILFMCCLGAQTETSESGCCSYREVSDFTLLFLLHSKLSKTWDDRFLIAQPCQYPQRPADRVLTLGSVWRNVLMLPTPDVSSNVWNNSKLFCDEALKRFVQ